MDLDAVAERVRRDRERAAQSAASARRSAGMAAFQTLMHTAGTANSVGPGAPHPRVPRERVFPQSEAAVENLSSVVRGHGSGPRSNSHVPAIHKHTAQRTSMFVDPEAASFERAVLAGSQTPGFQTNSYAGGLASTRPGAGAPVQGAGAPVQLNATGGFPVETGDMQGQYYQQPQAVVSGGLGEGPGMSSRNASAPPSPNPYTASSYPAASARPALEMTHGAGNAVPAASAASTVLDGSGFLPAEAGRLVVTPPATPGRGAGGVSAPSPRPRGTPSTASVTSTDGWASGPLHAAGMESSAVDLPPPAAGPVPLAKRLLLPPSEEELREEAAAAASRRRGGSRSRRQPPSSAHDDLEVPPPAGPQIHSPLSRIAASIRARRTMTDQQEPQPSAGGLELPRAARSSLAADISGTSGTAAPPAAPLPGSLAHRLGLRQARPTTAPPVQEPAPEAVAAPSPRPRHPSVDAGAPFVSTEVTAQLQAAAASTSPAARRAAALSEMASLAASAASYALQISGGGGAGPAATAASRSRSAGRGRNASPAARGKRAPSAQRGRSDGSPSTPGVMPPQLAFAFPTSPGRAAPPRSRSASRDGRPPGVATVYSPVPFQQGAAQRGGESNGEEDEDDDEEEEGEEAASRSGSTASRPTASRGSSPAGTTLTFGLRAAKPAVQEDSFADFSDRVKRYEAIRERKLREQEQRKAQWTARRRTDGQSGEDAELAGAAGSNSFLPANVLAAPPAEAGPDASARFSFGGRVPLRRRDKVSLAATNGGQLLPTPAPGPDTPAAVSALPDTPVSAPPMLHIPLPPGAPASGVIVFPAGTGGSNATLPLAAAAPALPARHPRPASAARSRYGDGDAASVVSASTRGREAGAYSQRPPSAAAASTVSSRLRSASRSSVRAGTASTPGGAAATVAVPGEGLAERVRRAGAISPSPAKTAGVGALPGTTGRATSPRIPVRPSLGGSTSVSNKQRIVNALSFVCLAGPHRSKELAAAMSSIDACAEGGGVSHFLVLLASPESSAYKGLYAFDPATGETVRVHGLGPLTLTECVRETMGLPPLPAEPAPAPPAPEGGEEETASTADTTTVTAATTAPAAGPRFKVTGLFKYDAVHRGFAALPSAGVALTTDALSIKALGAAGRRK